MQNIKIPVKPGSMATDVVENDLGSHRHKLVQNFRQERINEWKNVRGYINSYNSGGSTLVNGIEVSDDLSGDRFLIYQDDQQLKRLDYDSSNSPNTGYENESPSTLTLPSGVTIGEVKCRFFYHNGIIRISGPSEPLWYGYISRTIFGDSWSELYTNDFETAGDENDFTAVNANKALAGVGTLFEGAQYLDVTQISSGGYVYRSFTVTNGKKFKVLLHGWKTTGGGTDAFQIRIGTTQNGSEYAEIESTDMDEWFAFEGTYTATSTTMYLSLIPHKNQNGDTAKFDYVEVYQGHEVTVAGWNLYKAGPEEKDLDVYGRKEYYNSGATQYTFFMKTTYVYDESQYTILKEITRDSTFTDFQNTKIAWEIISGAIDYCKLKIEIPADVAISGLNKRISGVNICIGYTPVSSGYDEDSITWRSVKNFSFDELKEINYNQSTCSFNGTNADRIYFDTVASGEPNVINDGDLMVGQIISIKTRYGEINKAKILALVENSGSGFEYMQINTTLAPLFSGGSLPGVATDIPGMAITAEPFWQYSASGYYIEFGVSLISGTSFSTLTGFGQAVTDINPDYSHWMAVNGRPYCLSLEDEEQDVVRYGPIDQYDVFPNTFIIQTPVGDIDQNVGLVERDYRFVILKRNSISQGQFQSSSFYHDRKGKRRGLYVTDGYIVIDDVLYFMDKDDILMFNGVNIREMLTDSLIRQEYVDNVDQDNSFFVYNKDDKELWAVLNGRILVYHFERNAWYIRVTDITPKFGLVDINNRTFLASTAKFVLYNHSETTFDESIICKITSGLVDLRNPENHKRLHLVKPRVKSNKNLMLTATDVNESGSYSATKTPDATQVKEMYFKPKYLFKELTLGLIFATGNDVDITLKEFGLTVGAWRNTP